MAANNSYTYIVYKGLQWKNGRKSFYQPTARQKAKSFRQVVAWSLFNGFTTRHLCVYPTTCLCSYLKSKCRTKIYKATVTITSNGWSQCPQEMRIVPRIRRKTVQMIVVLICKAHLWCTNERNYFADFHNQYNFTIWVLRWSIILFRWKIRICVIIIAICFIKPPT